MDHKLKKGEGLGKMIVIATNGHNGQFDKGGKPYILHALAVMYLLNTDDEELQQIAVGHDLFEDTKVTKKDLRDAGISDRVIDGIWALTKLPGETLDEYKIRVFANKDAMRVKTADLTHNSDIRRLKGVSQKDIERMAKYHQFYLEIKSRLDDIE